MHKKLTVVLLGVLAVGAIQTRAQTTAPETTPAPAAPAAAAAPAAPAAPSWSTTITPSYVSVYMFRGSRLSGQSFQPSISSTYGNWTLGVWASDPLDNADKVFGQSDPEIDPSASYTIAFNDSLNIQPGFTWYTYLRAPTNYGYYKMTFEPKIALNWTVAGLTLSPTYYYDVVLDTATYELDAAYSVPLKDYGTSLNFNATIGTYYGANVVNFSVPRAHDWGNYWLVGLTLPYQVNKASSVSVGVAYTEGSDAYIKVGTALRQANSEAVGRSVISISYAYTF